MHDGMQKKRLSKLPMLLLMIPTHAQGMKSFSSPHAIPCFLNSECGYFLSLDLSEAFNKDGRSIGYMNDECAIALGTALRMNTVLTHFDIRNQPGITQTGWLDLVDGVCRNVRMPYCHAFFQPWDFLTCIFFLQVGDIRKDH